MYQFTLLRHAQSQANVEAIYQGQSNTSLSEIGRLQAQALADRWQAEGRHFDGIFASALDRASQTADIANQALGAPIEYDMLWAERDLGELTGITHAEAPQLMPPPPFVNPFTPYGHTGPSGDADVRDAGHSSARQFSGAALPFQKHRPDRNHL